MRGYRSIYKSGTESKERFAEAVQKYASKEILLRLTSSADKSVLGSMSYGEESADNPFINFTPLDGAKPRTIQHRNVLEISILES